MHGDWVRRYSNPKRAPAPVDSDCVERQQFVIYRGEVGGRQRLLPRLFACGAPCSKVQRNMLRDYFYTNSQEFTSTLQCNSAGSVILFATSMNTLNTPYNDCFMVNTLWEVRPVTSTSCLVTIYLKVILGKCRAPPGEQPIHRLLTGRPHTYRMSEPWGVRL